MITPTTLEVPDFLSWTIGIVVYFVGVSLTRQFRILRDYNIPEPVTGGLMAALVTLAIYLIGNISVSFDLQTRDLLLVYFFTTIGLNARVADLVRGGKPLLILLVLTVGYIVVQDVVGIVGAALFGIPQPVGILIGSASLIGGHGTAIAWAPEIVKKHGIENAMEIGIAAATFGLILASLIGGPIAKFLIHKHDLKAEPEPEEDGTDVVGLPYDGGDKPTINHITLMQSVLAIHIAIIIGYFVDKGIAMLGIKLPLFVSCLLVAIVLSNLISTFLPRMSWPARSPALALLSDYSLNIFLAMSLMSMQLWTIGGLGGPLLGILGLQTVVVVLFIIFLLFWVMGRNYEAAVLSAGFGGFALGATPTAIANMTAVTKKHGPAPNAFIMLPLIAAFFVDIANSIIIGLFLG